MILDFKTYKQNTYNCYDAMIAVVGDYYSIDIAPIVYQANEIKELSQYRRMFELQANQYNWEEDNND